MRCHPCKLSACALCVLLLCLIYVFPVYRVPRDEEILEEVLRHHGHAWKKNQTGIDLYRKLLNECCAPQRLFALTKENTPVGKSLWYDQEFHRSHLVDNESHSIFVQASPLPLPLKKCAVVGNGGILRHSQCGRAIDKADFVMRCNLPPLSKEYVDDVGTKTHLVTANPSIIEKKYQSLLWRRKSFVDYIKAYGSSFIYMPGFSTLAGTELSKRVAYTLADSSSNLTMLFANPHFLNVVGQFWKERGVHARRLSTGLFMVSLALGLCDEVSVYGFWPLPTDLEKKPISHHYYDNMQPDRWIHAMPEEFVQLWELHKSGTLRVNLGSCG
ncbi:alpha-N-acetylneuraminide alpha-2,8-sialyltransferase [Corythoichthys intestinalis]|uniref:alpha-N-acetylneuraminide alpha-2,8-sialyltransferase n=1 Tax=Corythoichthys intestinalis TaxID=161448 RepID=UPI0025A59350|nr:alpha-N-acetylneuraminide alpha-2,8-sialyltransferase [Corythoichthys intestinalis]XP_061809467.1 alpha-N-acetylneuraminide alpha-2,8-sialyltransferase-like [Nerophis lumbriciformis]